MSVTITLYNHDRLTGIKGLNDVVEMSQHSIVDAVKKRKWVERFFEEF